MGTTVNNHFFTARRLILALACILLLPGVLAAAEQPLYVQSQQAAMLAEARADAAVIAQLARGDAVQLLDSNPSWHKVRKGEQEGWVFRYFLAAHPPLQQAAPALADDVDRDHARRRASAVVTAGATRGLTQQERERAHQQGVADYNALTRMEDTVVDSAQVQLFIQAGIPQ